MACTSKGPQGPEGPAGPAGPAGAQGATGPQGPAGAQGERGETGATGATGATGETGAQGPQGLQGPQGAVLVVDGGVIIGPSGASVAVTQLTSGDAACANGGVRITQLSDGGITNLCNGAMGPAGPQGVAGPQGAPGAQGIQGPSGSQGAMGLQGPQGEQGVAGPAGPTGPSGSTGPQGATGPQGPQGAQGIQGPAGVPGITASLLPNMSVQCVAGGVLLTFADGGTSAVCNGTQGQQGLQGIQGPQGNPGSPGVTGSQGPAGPAGPQGAAGPSGPSGPAGAVLYLDGGVISQDWVVFAGFTASSFTGNLGGITGANAKCDADYPGSFMCTQGDYWRGEPNGYPPTTGAWIDYERDEHGTRSIGGCYTSANGPWTEGTNNDSASSLNAVGNFQSANCNVMKPLACCKAPRKRTLRGFTSATYTGNLGGPIGANAKCNAEFPGSIFCTQGDFGRAETSASPGGTAAWIDYNRDEVSGIRSIGGCYTSASGPWTEGTNNDSASSVSQYGSFASSNCNVVRRLACCQ